MATAIRAIPTLYGETAKHFEMEAMQTEQNPGPQDYRHEAEVVSEFLKTCPALWLGAKVPFVPTDVDDGEQEVEDVTGLVAEYRWQSVPDHFPDQENGCIR